MTSRSRDYVVFQDRNYCLFDSKDYSFVRMFFSNFESGFCTAITCFKFNFANKYFMMAKEKHLPGERKRKCAVNNSTERHRARTGVRHRSCRCKAEPIFCDSPRGFSKTMSQVPLLSDMKEANNQNTVMLEVGLPGDTWKYCVERHRLAEKSEWFRALLLGPLASQREQTITLQHVDKRAFDHLLRFLHDETVTFQSISTARSTLDVAHQYLCPELAHLAVDYLNENLKPSTVLEVYQGLSLYASDLSIGRQTSIPVPTAPPAPEDHAGEIACACSRLLNACLRVIDANPDIVFAQERFEELNGQEVANLASRDSLQLTHESNLFSALERWATSECKRHGMEPNAINKRKVLTDDILFSVRFLLMSDKEFMNLPMASNMLTSEESAFIMANILGHDDNHKNDLTRRSASEFLMRLNRTPRGKSRGMSSSNREREDNKKNRRKECANQSQKVCAQIGNCFVRVLACVFD